MKITGTSEHSWTAGIRLDRVWAVIFAILCVLAFLDRSQLVPTIQFTIDAVLSTAPFMVLAIVAIGFLKATGAERLVANAFQGNELVMIALASLVGGIAPFCSCEIIPFIAALLAVGTPLSAVMALWLASPLMDPSMFLLTAGELGWNFAIAKVLVAIAIGFSGGLFVRTAMRAGHFQDVLLAKTHDGCGCGPKKPFDGQPVWKFWQEDARTEIFWKEVRANGFFLLKWLALAYLFESLLIRYIPAEAIAGVVGGTGLMPILVSALVGVPAYLNGYAAPAIVSGFVDHGMTQGAAMTFMIAGGVTSIPAMTAVYALVKRSVFFSYVGLGMFGAILSGIAFNGFLIVMA